MIWSGTDIPAVLAVVGPASFALLFFLIDNVCGGDFDTICGWLLIEESEGGISEVDGASSVGNDAVVVVGKKLEGIGARDRGG